MLTDRQLIADHRHNKLPMQAGNFLPMGDSDQGAVMQLSRNIDLLLQHHQMSIGTLSERSGVSLRQLNNIRRRAANTSIETVASIGSVFKLTVPEMLSPQLMEELDRPDAVKKFPRIYSHTSDEGRRVVDSALLLAEKMAEYSTPKK